MEQNGDDFLSGFDRKLWQLHHYIVLRWHVYTIFKNERWDARYGIPGLIEWFIPKGHPDAEEIAKFVGHELEREYIPPPKNAEEACIPGREVRITVCAFSGIESYMIREDVDKLAKQMIDNIKIMLEERKKKE